MLNLSEHGKKSIAPRDRRPIYEWAADHVPMPSTLAKGGNYDPNCSRHHHAIFDALQDDHVREVVLRKPIRGGGTLISDVWHCWVRANDAGPQMVVLQDDAEAKAHAEERAMPMLKSCEPIKALLPDDRHNKRKQEIIFKDGLFYYIWGPAIGNLQRKSIRFMTVDEVWALKEGIVEQAEGRLGDFVKVKLSKLFLVSQGGDDEDQFERRFQKGSMRFWSLPCLKCSHMNTVQFWQNKRGDGSRWGIVWDEHKDKSGMWLPGRAAETARFECEKCGHPHIDDARTKSEWNRRGDYVRTNPDAKRESESLCWPGLIDYPFGFLVEKYLSGINTYKRKDPSDLIAFYQKYSPEPKNEGGLFADNDPFKRVLYEVDTSTDFNIKSIAVDRQMEDLFWVLYCEWSKDGRVRRRWFGKMYSFAEIEESRVKWEVPPRHVLIDSKYQPRGKHGVYAACARYGWIAVRSEGTDVKGKRLEFFEHKKRIVNGREERYTIRKSHSPADKQNCIRVDPEEGASSKSMRRKEVLFIRFCGATMKDRSQQLVDSGDWPEDAKSNTEMDKEFRRQFNAEYLRIGTDSKGREFSEWVQRGKDNHGRDDAAIQCLFATIKGILSDGEASVETGTSAVRS